MSITEIFLPGWGFSASIWQLYYPPKGGRKFIDLSDFSHNNENSVLSKLQQEIPENSIIYAWSISCLWLLQLLLQRRIQICKAYFYSPPLALNFANSKKKQGFIDHYLSAPQNLTKKFIRLVAYPSKDRKLYTILNQHCQLTDQRKHLHYLNYLKWMLKFSISDQELLILLKDVDYEIMLGADDAIVDVTAINWLPRTNCIDKHGHFMVMPALNKGVLIGQ